MQAEEGFGDRAVGLQNRNRDAILGDDDFLAGPVDLIHELQAFCLEFRRLYRLHGFPPQWSCRACEKQGLAWL